MNVKARESLPYSRGFKCTLSFSDGHGVAHLPRTGRSQQVGGSHTMSASEFGVTNTFQETPELRRLFDLNRDKINSRMPALNKKDRDYRQVSCRRRCG